MQSLFAYEQSKAANMLLARDFISESFVPGFYSIEEEGKDLLIQKEKQALVAFDKRLPDDALDDIGDGIGEVVKKAWDMYNKEVLNDKERFQKHFIREIQSITPRYFQLLYLLCAWKDHAAASTKKPYGMFAANPFLVALTALPEMSNKANVSQKQQMTLMARMWFKLLAEDPAFIAYNAQSAPDKDADIKMIKHVIRKIILGENAIGDYLEEIDLYWVENKSIIRSMLDKTLKSFESGKVVLQQLSPEWAADEAFAQELFKLAVDVPDELHTLIADNTRKWDINRLPLTDRVILNMAVMEMTGFPNIPVKVSINEYIELAKAYSTPNSRQFVNGILDVVAKILLQQGAIRKTGRGLIDNK